MRWARVGLVLIWSLLAAMGLGRSVGAQDGSFDVHFQAPPGCPDEREFVRQITLRTAKAHEVSRSTGARTFSVGVDSTDAERFLGRLTIQDRSGGADVRAVPGRSCMEVVEAIALIAAVTIDPKAYAEALPAASASSRGQPAPTQGALVSAVRPALAPPVSSTVSPATSNPHARWQVGGGVTAFVVGAAAPSPVVGMGLYAEAVHTGRLLAPSIRLAGQFGESGYANTPRGDALFRLLAARLGFCPLRLAIGKQVVARPCVSCDIGSLHAQGSNTQSPKSTSMLWLALGASGRAEWQPSKSWVLAAEAGLVLPTARDTFVFVPDVTIHRIPWLSAFAGLEAGVRWP